MFFDVSAKLLRRRYIPGSSPCLGFRGPWPHDAWKPASGRPWDAFQQLASFSTRGPVFQSVWAPVPFWEPTGLLANCEAIINSPLFHRGWPCFDATGRYSGPLPLRKSLDRACLKRIFYGKRQNGPDSSIPFFGVPKLAAALISDWRVSLRRISLLMLLQRGVRS